MSFITLQFQAASDISKSLSNFNSQASLQREVQTPRGKSIAVYIQGAVTAFS